MAVAKNCVLQAAADIGIYVHILVHVLALGCIGVLVQKCIAAYISIHNILVSIYTYCFYALKHMLGI